MNKDHASVAWAIASVVITLIISLTMSDMQSDRLKAQVVPQVSSVEIE